MLIHCLEESCLSLSKKDKHALFESFFESADRDNDGRITLEELRLQLMQFPEILENLTLRYSAKTIGYKFRNPTIKQSMKCGHWAYILCIINGDN